MKKSENLVATLLAIYAIILTLCIAIYAILKLLEVDITLATNLLVWSATIFAPIAVLMTFTSWEEQRSGEEIAKLASKLFSELNEVSCFIKDIVHLQNPKLRNELLARDNANYLLKKFPSIISIHIDDLVRVRKYCGNDEYSKIINTFLLETNNVHQYIVYSSWEWTKVDYQGLDLSNYYQHYRQMCDSLFEIAIYRH